MTPEIEKAYQYCESVTKEHAKSFYFAAKFLPKEKRQPIYALYALCRHVDDEVDEAEVKSEQEAINAVERWKKELARVYEGKEQSATPQSAEFNQVFIAWHDLLRKYKIPQNLPLELMKGVLMDTHIKRYKTFDELYLYCYRVASTVGLMSSEIFGYTEPRTLEYAEALGIAMQITNILRDISEDAAMDRIYLPQEDLRRFNISETQIYECRMSDDFVKLIKFEIARARDYYKSAENGIPLLDKDARFTVLLALRIYSKILNEIERQNYDVFKRRAHTTKVQKILMIPAVWRESKSL